MKKLSLVEDHPIFAEAFLLVPAQRVDLKVVRVVNTAEKRYNYYQILAWICFWSACRYPN